MNCCICLDEKDEFIILKCSHKICDECYPELEKITNKCPYCRSLFKEEVSSKNIYYSDENESFLGRYNRYLGRYNFRYNRYSNQMLDDEEEQREQETESHENIYLVDPFRYNQTILEEQKAEEPEIRQFYMTEQAITRVYRSPREHVELVQEDIYTIERELERKELYRLQRQKEIYEDEQRRKEVYDAQRERHLKRNKIYRNQRELELKEREIQLTRIFEYLKSKNLISENAVYEFYDKDYIMKIYEDYIEECSKIKLKKYESISKDVRRNRKILRQERYNETMEREQMFSEDNLKDNVKEIEEKIKTLREQKLMVKNDVDITKILIEKEIADLNRKAKEDKIKVIKPIKEEKPKKERRNNFLKIMKKRIKKKNKLIN